MKVIVDTLMVQQAGVQVHKIRPPDLAMQPIYSLEIQLPTASFSLVMTEKFAQLVSKSIREALTGLTVVQAVPEIQKN